MRRELPGEIAQHFLYRGECSRASLAVHVLHSWSRAFPLTETARFNSLALIGAGRRCLRTSSFSHLVWIRVRWRYAMRSAQRVVPPHRCQMLKGHCLRRVPSTEPVAPQQPMHRKLVEAPGGHAFLACHHSDCHPLAALYPPMRVVRHTASLFTRDDTMKHRRRGRPELDDREAKPSLATKLSPITTSVSPGRRPARHGCH